MSYKFEEGKDEIIEAVVKKIKERMPNDQIATCAEFARQFYNTVALDDLKEWDIDDLYGAVINYWALMQNRAPNETKIRIYNPDFERHGWQTTHTVVEIISKDIPFLVDSVRMVVNRLGLASHLIIHMGGIRLLRDENHAIKAVLPQHGEPSKEASVEAAIFMEIDRQTSPKMLNELHHQFERVLEDNRLVVEDWMLMREKVRELIAELDELAHVLDKSEVEETKAFLHWIEDHHFTFLGIRDYELCHKNDEIFLESIPDTGMGVLRQGLTQSSARSISAMTPEARELTLSSRILVMSKTNTLASVHRDAYTDYIGVKRFDKEGKVKGETRIIGLYTSAAYNTNPKHIPFLRHKVAQIMKSSLLNPRSHAGKILLNIIETLPRDDLIQASEDELLEIAMGIFHMQERRRIRMFARTDVYGRFVSCLVYVPRDRFNTELRKEMGQILQDSLNGKDVSFSTRFSESVLARIHFIIRIDPKDTTEFNFQEIEEKLIEVGRLWTDDLEHQLVEAFGEEKGNQLYELYKDAFPEVYKTNFSPRTALHDIKHIEALSQSQLLKMNFYCPVEEHGDHFRLKIYQHNTIIPLSDVIPIIENLGMRAISERPYKLKFKDKTTWINDFSMQYIAGNEFKIEEIKELFQNAFANIWFGNAENDGFNQLILGATLNWRQVAVLRTYAKYFKQIGFTFSLDYIISALNKNASITKKLVQLFELHFNPEKTVKRQHKIHDLVSEILTDLDMVENLDEDKIIRQYVQAITSTLRTNFYQTDKDNHPKRYISIKLDSKTISGVPRPYPMFEIFVYSPQFEGVHLRGGKVARGGLRWSDRKEDFRTEILGLMKAQQVKNAIIVPSGAKGGFVAKQLPVHGSREDILAEGISCYKQFIRGLLDITDNYQDGSTIIKPDNVVCYDQDDPYLVVAADKGTATFSDIANEISIEYGYWLGDAFASGGSVGYDHKKMGITAKGAWESVKRHFYEMDKNIQREDFTVVGIGDMAGDVFGNGMLLSKHIKLVAAFNHLHIFIDPDPDPKISFKERERLFKLPRSAWTDYDKKLISKGGGVFNRNAKSISVSKEMKALFGIKQANIEPNELIRNILCAQVDLLLSAGIGTFVKAHTETNLDVGDRTNDSIRINANKLRCKVVGEGGNLGLTQLARVEYASNGGLIYTDFIDNSAGVSCSDKEVNIKILLNMIVEAGDLTFKHRNKLLAEMTDEVAKLVLNENYLQTRAISLIATQANRSIELHRRYINELEHLGKLDRNLEFLPDEKALQERKLSGKGLTRPGIAVLFCYSKIILKEAILPSDVPEDPYLKQFLLRSFPKPLRERFSKQMQDHPLKREIIATKLSNLIINEMGFTFVYRLQDETGAPVSAIVRAYMIARSVINIDAIWEQIEALDGKISAQTQDELMILYVRLLRRITRWFLRTQRMKLDITKTVKLYAPGVDALKKALPDVYSDNLKEHYERTIKRYQEQNISKELAHELTITRGLFPAMDIIEVALQSSIDVEKVAEVYFGIGELLELAWIRKQVIIHPTENRWEALSREALRDDLDWQQRQLAAGILQYQKGKKTFLKCYEEWSDKHSSLIERWHHVLSNLRSSSALNYTMFFVATRELLDLTQTTIQVIEKKPVSLEAS